jgi:MFS family permease
LHPAAFRPGVILFLGASGYAGFSSFVPLYVDEIGLDDAGPAFVEYAVIVLSVRILGSRLPDVLGPRRGPLAALALQSTGLLLMGLWAAPAGLYVATAIYACGVSLLYPALFPVVVDAAPPEERSHAIATFTLGFDLSMGLGAPLLGLVVALTGERGAFVTAGLLSALGFLLHRSTRTPARAPVATA